MYLSRLTFPLADPEAQRLVAEPYEMHRALMAAFPENAERVLYRVEPVPRGHSRAVVLVQSLDPPDWSATSMPPSAESDAKEFDAAFRAGQSLRFRLRANPTARRKIDGSEKSKRVGLTTEEDQRDWLARKGEQGGFRPDGVVVIDEGQVKAAKPNGRTLTFRSVRFEGALEVTEPERFAQALQAGIGTAKAFGFGLLSVAKV